MINTDITTKSSFDRASLNAILIGGAPDSGKSVLTYKLSQILRKHKVPHYVFHASTELEGDWFLQGNPDTVRAIRKGISKDSQKWTQEFRDAVCHDLKDRFMPLLVDLGGNPQEEDQCIFQSCTNSILLLRDDNKKVTQTWHDYISKHQNIKPIAEIFSQKPGISLVQTTQPILTGSITNLERDTFFYEPLGDEMLDALVALVSKKFTYPPDVLEQWHRSLSQIQPVLDLDRERRALSSTREEWSPQMVNLLLKKISMQTILAVYGRAPNWLYGALALHTQPQPFHQFDARLGWVQPPDKLHTTTEHISSSIIEERENTHNDYILFIHPVHNYFDYHNAHQLLFPEPPPNRGVIIDGKLPLWLSTALSRLYVQRDIPWIALNDARDDQPVVIYSRVSTHAIGKKLPKLPQRPRG